MRRGGRPAWTVPWKKVGATVKAAACESFLESTTYLSYISNERIADERKQYLIIPLLFNT